MRAHTFLKHSLTSKHRKRGFLAFSRVGILLLALPGTALSQVRFPPPSPPPQPLQAQAQTPAAVAPATPTPTQSLVPPPAPATVQAGSVAAQPAAAQPIAPALPVSGLAPTTAPTSNVAPWPPAVLPYREGMPLVPGYRLESEMRTGLVYGGLAVFGVPYVAGLVAAAASGFTKGSGWLALPLAGPFVAMGGRSIDCTFTEISSGSTDTNLNKKEAACRDSAIKEARVVALLTVAGLVQTAGAILTIAGLTTQDKTLVRKDLYPEPTDASPRITVDGAYEQGRVRLTAQLTF